LVTISGKKNRVRVYYLSWLKGKILRTEGGEGERRNGYINVGELQASFLVQSKDFNKVSEFVNNKGYYFFEMLGGNALQNSEV